MLNVSFWFRDIRIQYRGKVVSVSNFWKKSTRFWSIIIRVWPKKDPANKENGDKFLLTPTIRVHNCESYSMTVVLRGFIRCSMAVNICFISFDLTVVGFWVFLLFFGRGWTEKFIAFPTGNCMFKANNRNTRTRCEIYPKLTITLPERRHWRRCGIFIVNFEHISHLVLEFLLLTLSR